MADEKAKTASKPATVKSGGKKSGGNDRGGAGAPVRASDYRGAYSQQACRHGYAC